MLDLFFKLLLVAVVSPIWLPILRSIREQMQEIEAQEREFGDRARLGSSTPTGFRRDATPPTVNEDLVEQPLAPTRPGRHAFRSEPSAPLGAGLQPRASEPGALRRAG